VGRIYVDDVADHQPVNLQIDKPPSSPPVFQRRSSRRRRRAAKRVLEFFTTQIENDHTRNAYMNATRRFAHGFFTVNISNRNTRAAYAHAAAVFLRWCEGQGISALVRVQPVHVDAYIEQLSKEMSPPSVKQHLACIRMLFDWLVTGQVVPVNPAHPVRGPRHSVSKGVTPVLSSEEATALLTGMDVSTVVGLQNQETSLTSTIF
jgi:hypothetical protein